VLFKSSRKDKEEAVMEKRTVWFVLNQRGNRDSEELYLRFGKLITFWQRISVDSSTGCATYSVTCEGESFGKLHELFEDLEFRAVWGILRSGAVEGGLFQDWPAKTEYERTVPPVLTTKAEKLNWVQTTINKILGKE
jgi:hypothetical protein